MSELLRSEIAEVLSRHSMVEADGWSRASGVVEYQCKCGELFVVDTRTPGFVSRDAQMSNHRAAAIESLGVRRATDHLDESALEAVVGLVSERTRAAVEALSMPAACATGTDLTRIEGALTELNELSELLAAHVRTRANNGYAELFSLRP